MLTDLFCPVDSIEISPAASIINACVDGSNLIVTDELEGGISNALFSVFSSTLNVIFSYPSGISIAIFIALLRF